MNVKVLFFDGFLLDCVMVVKYNNLDFDCPKFGKMLELDNDYDMYKIIIISLLWNGCRNFPSFDGF